ncbi:uncharacterized protein [Antedon mediterranea]|uniref:uncharacterized protein n=1 Tax=Antedon mediterranea TaxID=105859 RepID=UPI003AF722C0
MKSFAVLACLFVLAQSRTLPVPKVWEEWDHDEPIFVKRICEETFFGLKIERCCEGWQGDRCRTPVCSSPCVNGGSCISPDTCECPPGLSGPTCSDFDENEYCWTMWNNLDEPSTGLGDFERIIEHREQSKICQGSEPIAIECRTTGGISWFDVAQTVTCDLERGFECEHSQQKSSTCEDYEVRFLCSCGKGGKDKVDDKKKPETTIVSTVSPTVENKTCFIGNTSINPGMTFNFGCRTCNCSIDGTWLCEMNSTCMVNETFTPGLCEVNMTTIIREQDITTIDCNVCVCTNSSSLACTKMICPAKSDALMTPMSSRCYDNEGLPYEENTLRKKDCNVCVCTKGKWDCTRLDCSQDIFTAQMPQNVCTDISGKTYLNGETLVKDCNAWTCSKGEWASTRRYCSPVTYPNTTCLDTNTSSILTNGKTIRRGCNICVCNSGNLTCTSEECPMETSGICLRKLQRYLINNMTNTTRKKMYPPSCNTTNGLYQPVQCYGKRCYCVTPYGSYIPSTYSYGKKPNCSAFIYNITMPPMTEIEMIPLTEIEMRPEEVERMQEEIESRPEEIESRPEEMKRKSEKMEKSYRKPTLMYESYNLTCNQRILKSLMSPMSPRPTCLPDGSYTPTQCCSESKMCYCVYSNGTYINGTLTHISNGIPLCRNWRPEVESSFPELSTCKIKASIAKTLKLPYVPTCTEDGSFSPIQCNIITGVCFCVDYLGDIVPETVTTRAGITTLTCEMYHTEEWRQQKKDRIMPSKIFSHIIDVDTFPERMPACLRQQKIAVTMKNIYSPSCRDDGSFEPLQCPTKSRVCFCVDITGTVVANTTSGELTPPNCDMYHNVSLFNFTAINNSSFLGSLPTECKENCTTVGVQTLSEETLPSNRTNITLSACGHQQVISSIVPGVFRPTCNANGTFSPLQCQPQSGICYCVDTNGVRIESTEAKIYLGNLPSCQQYWNFTIEVVTNMTSVYPEELQMVNALTPNNINISSLMNFTTAKFNFTSLFNQTTLSMLNQSEWNMTLHTLMFNSTQWNTSLFNDTLLSTIMNVSTWNTTVFNTVFNESIWNQTDFNRLFNASQWNSTLYTVMFNSSMWNTTFFDVMFNVTQWNDTMVSWLFNVSLPNVTCNFTKYNKNPRIKDCFKMQKLASWNPEFMAPTCNPNNTYTALQCNRKTGYCYCSYLNGVAIPETVTPIIEGTPSCWQYSTVNITNMTLTEKKIANFTKETWTLANRGIMWNMTLNYLYQINRTFTMVNQTCFIGNMSIASGTNATFGCQVCNCTDGIWKCKMNDTCMLNETFTPGVCQVNETTILMERDITTVDCNVCVCARNNSLVCTNMMCPAKRSIEDVAKKCLDTRKNKWYDEDTVLRMSCNVCLCSQGEWDCTDEKCPWFNEEKACIVGVGESYPHGTTLLKDCNAWTCNNAKWIGTQRYCSPLTYPESSCLDHNTSTTLTNGQMVRRGCNVCVCNSGNMVCTDVECPTNSSGICYDQLNRFLYGNSSVMAYRPRCNATNGLYQPVQCCNMSNMCFCVDPVGQYLPGSLVYKTMPNCSAYIYNVTRPKLNFTEILNTTQLQPTDINWANRTCRQLLFISIINKYVARPTCLPDGSFAPLQCTVEGNCYCAYRNGTYVNGTLTHISKGTPMCMTFRDTLEFVTSEVVTETPTLTSCVFKAKLAKEVMLPHVPTCDSRGMYTPLQCNTMTGLCFCVDIQGMVIKDTTVLMTERTRPDCIQYRTEELNKKLSYQRTPLISSIITDEKFPDEISACETQKIVASDLKTVFMPKCDSTGSYVPYQCPTNTDVCFCVDKTGTVIANTTTMGATSSPDMCDKYRNVSLLPRMMVNATVYEVFPYFCDTDCPKTGPQFNSSLNYTLPVNTTRPTRPSCVRQLVISSLVPGVFRPTCLKNGTFSPLQCQPQSGICYCVDRMGVTIQGTAQKVSQEGLPNCSMYWNTTLPVNMNRTSFMIEEMQAMNEMNLETVNVTELFNLTNIFNASMPFNISQFNATLWNITGVNTTQLGTERQAWSVKTDCFKRQLYASRRGMFVPSCNRDNTYTALQCNRETGMCYCSLPNGYALTGTVTPITEGTPSCWQYPQAFNMTMLNNWRLSTIRRAYSNWTDTLNSTSSVVKPSMEPTAEPIPPRRLYDPLSCKKIGNFVVYCYCTRPSGAEVDGTRQYFSIPDCRSYPDMCEARGQFYNPGEKVIKKPTQNGCQSCTCTSGSWMCEYTMECEEEGQITTTTEPLPTQTVTPSKEMPSSQNMPRTTLEPHVCQHEGISYNSGQVHSWDCRTCTCINYQWVCSTRNCDTTTIATTNVPVVTTIGYRDCTIGDMVFDHLSTFNIGCTECTCTDGEAICSSRNCQ